MSYWLAVRAPPSLPKKKKLQSVYYSPAEIESGYTYVPLDPFPVTLKPGTECERGAALSRETLLEALPDNAVRMLTEKFDASGAVTYGASKVQGEGDTYRVTIDYIYSDTMNRRLYISKSVMPLEPPPPPTVTYPGQAEYVKEPRRTIVPIGSPPTLPYVFGSEEYRIRRTKPENDLRDTPAENRPAGTTLVETEYEQFNREFSEYNIPVYVGVGLRVSANIYGVKGNANISGLGIIGAEAELNNLKGSLIIQTLGVNGKAVAAALPIQSELNRTTAQNAIVAIGTIKALLHSPETWVAPRVVGLYLPFPGGKALVNALISELSRGDLAWEFTCFGRDISSSK